jgi:hypothetical protein
MLRTSLLLLTALPLLATPVPKDATPPKSVPNSNALLKAYNGRMKFDSSSEFNGWAIAKLFDGDEQTSWYSATGDSSMGGKQPWVRATFPEDVKVRRVTILGNREPQYPGYFVLNGTLELLDADGDILQKVELESKGEKHDFDYELRVPEKNVRAVRFTSTKDENSQNCIGLGEMQVE